MGSCRAVIFDFDDTLVYTNEIFDQARMRLFSVLGGCGYHDVKSIADFLNKTDIANVEKRGYLAADCFPLAMRQTYEHFSRLAGNDIDVAIADICENIGWQVYKEPMRLIPGAEDILTYLSETSRLILLTQGEEYFQLPRLEQSGLLKYFDKYYICRDKNIAQLRKVIAEQNIDTAKSWYIGNSFKSDINPAIEVGMKAVHYSIDSWDFEHELPKGFYYQTKTLTSLMSLVKE